MAYRRMFIGTVAAAVAAAGLTAASAPPARAATVATQNFDSLAGQLQPALDESIPAGTLGWTHTAPAGWSVAVKPSMADGVREWRGWSFTTMPFWTAADTQDRGNFTRASGVFAVADPDEWDDRGNPTASTTFDSTLSGQPVAIPSGTSTLYLGFASHYRQEGNQKADVTVSFDGGAASTIVHYGPNAADANGGADAQNAYVTRAVSVPAGATTARFAWRLYDAANNWYWAIDDVTVADTPISAPPPPVPNPVPAPTLPNGVSTAKTLVIGLDGLRNDKITQANAPNLWSLVTGGLYGTSLLYSQPMAQTLSGPGWSTIATGAWPDKAGVTDNTFAGQRYAQFPDFLTRMEQARPALSTFAAVDWAALGTKGTFSSAIDGRVVLDGDGNGYTGEDARIADVAARVLHDQNPDAAFVYLGAVDEAGHASGAASPAYLAALARSDAQVGQLLTAVRTRATYAGEHWLIEVATDHGHTDAGGHGGNSIPERRTFVIANGPGIAAGQRPIDTRLVDVAVTALGHVGVSVNPAWNLDGRSLFTTRADGFDAAYPALSGRVDETGIPAGVPGFTHTGAAGWTIDNSRMPTGGVTEWRGWALTTDEFWTRAEAGQSRELGVRGRGVIAVADTDEFADKTGGNAFDSALISPAYSVTGKTSVTLAYTTLYRQEGSQKGDVLVSFDGGPATTVKAYRADAIARDESLGVTVPAGARTMRVTFRMYDANNNWYWMLDGVTVR
ncbi:alkaline phosphatase family protein [Dactylosporangium sp. NPDC000244]|uniref:alkaline phosphatase family protein n=1 Tax=Dactylosporangium sp. NPDC000244 TaxID=3154365 RepID=UPI0033332ADE